MLGHGFFDEDKTYHLQTLKDNIKLLTPEILSEINKVVVDAAHEIVNEKDNNKLRSRCDSFVVETNVHFPTDINLLFDATRKVIQLTSRLCKASKIPGWRQSKHNIKQVKRQAFKLQKLKHSTSKDPVKALKKKKEIETAYEEYAKTARSFIEKARASEKELLDNGVEPFSLEEIHYFINHAERQIDQITRRVVQGEQIPHEEKVFSVFQPQTEWVCKGKAGVLVELGLKVVILESEQFVAAKKKHSAVESAINALEVHGLDRCPDSGIDGFKRYVGIAILARNIQIIGSILIKREQKKHKLVA